MSSAEAAKQPNAPKTIVASGEAADAKEKIKNQHTSELVIALCGPIGSPVHEVAERIKVQLETDFGYERCEVIRLSKLIEEHGGKATTESRFERTKSLISKGDKLRQSHGPSVLAELAVSKIVLDRQKELVRQKETDATARHKPRRVCHIIDSIKNQEELDILKLVYRDMLYFVGVYAPLSARVRALEDRGMNQGQIYQLVDQDSGEEFVHGQTVRDTFPQADFFLRVNSNTDSHIAKRVDRFLHLILGTRILTPTYAETAMYQAASAAGNSACLSRQVGAAITSADGEILAVGWNDVPKAKGGLYSANPDVDPNSDFDRRCWNLRGGMCFNDQEKETISELLVDSLISQGLIKEDKRSGAIDSVMGNSKVRDLIEFSRSIHAEMHAIITAAQIGTLGLKGAKLYSTTYPCHSCARHIVAAGITEVYYIEPYRKSLAIKLHNDSITEDERDESKVRILPFDGVAPARYLKLFRVQQDSRKRNGKLISRDPKTAGPKIDKTLEALPTLEALVVEGLRQKNLVKV